MSDAELDRWAAEQAPELIADAQARALAIARERLTARLVDGLLAAANARLSAAPGEDLLWVYGVVARPVSPPPGVDGRPVRVHEHGGIHALVSDVPRARFSEQALHERLEDLERLEALARSHEGVLEAAMAGGAVVPFRLCTIYASPETLDAMLARERAALTAALDRLEGMQEWGVKAFLAAPVAVAAEETASGTDYLTRKREQREAAEATREETDTVVAEIHARLTERATGAALSRPQDRRLSGRDSEMVLNAAYLVPADGVEAFRAIVEDLGRRHDLQLELTGPWPPYHFAEAPSRDVHA